MNIRKQIALRSIILGTVFTVLFFLLGVKVYWIQVVDAKWLNERAKEMWEAENLVQPKRGTIYDRNGQPLAYDGPSYNVIAVLSKKDPHHVTDPEEVANKLAPILEMDKQKMLEQLKRTDRYQVEFWPEGWKISQEKAEQIMALELPGILLQKNTKRYYPNHEFAAHTIGYVDKEGNAKMGLEFYYDELLRGKEGKYRFIKDGKNVVLPSGVENFEPAKNGYDLILTLDQRIQHFVEKALDEAEANFKPKRMTAIVADPNTMEILAMSSRPHFDPNNYRITNYINFATSRMYEPGSTFKIVTLAAAVEEGIFDPYETYKSGKYSDEYIKPAIRDHNNGQGWGEITFLEGVQRSSNVAFVTLGYERLGKEKLFSYYRNFGFGSKTGIDFPSEENGKLPDVNRVYPRDVAASTFGQGPIAVTAIQQVAAVAAVANGGTLYKPYLVKQVVDPATGEVVEEKEPTQVRQVISPGTAKKVSEILETVVTSEVGTGRAYAIEGYRVAGKTGTAQTVGPDGKYLENKYIYSFIGYAPVEDPKLIVYIVVEEPEVEVLSGSTIIAPIFKHVMKNSLQYLQVEPNKQEVQALVNHDTVTVPDLKNLNLLLAKQKVIDLGLEPIVIGSGENVLEYFPASGEEVPLQSNLYLITEKEKIEMPDLTGKSMREAVEIATLLGLKVDIRGWGYVAAQSIAAKTQVSKGQLLSLELKPINPADQPPQAEESEDLASDESDSPSIETNEEESNHENTSKPDEPVDENEEADQNVGQEVSGPNRSLTKAGSLE